MSMQFHFVEEDTEKFEGILFASDIVATRSDLRFVSDEVESLFIQHHYRSHWPVVLVGVMGALFIGLFVLIEEEYQALPFALLYVIPALAITAGVIVFLWTLNRRFGSASRLERCRVHEVVKSLFFVGVASPVCAGSQLAIKICSDRAPTPTLSRECFYMLEPYMFVLLLFPLVFHSRMPFKLIFTSSAFLVYLTVEFGFDIGTKTSESVNRMILTATWVSSTLFVGFQQEMRARRSFASLIALQHRVEQSRRSHEASESVLCSLMPRAKVHELGRGGVETESGEAAVLIVNIASEYRHLDEIAPHFSLVDFHATQEGLRRVGVAGTCVVLLADGTEFSRKVVAFCVKLREAASLHSANILVSGDYGPFKTKLFRAFYFMSGETVQYAKRGQDMMQQTTTPHAFIFTDRLISKLNAASIVSQEVLTEGFVAVVFSESSQSSPQLGLALEPFTAGQLRRGVLRLLESLHMDNSTAVGLGNSGRSIDEWLGSTTNPFAALTQSESSRSLQPKATTSSSHTSRTARTSHAEKNAHCLPRSEAEAGEAAGVSVMSVGHSTNSLASRAQSSNLQDPSLRADGDDLEFLKVIERKLEKLPKSSLFQVTTDYADNDVQAEFEQYIVRLTTPLRFSGALILLSFALIGTLTTGISDAFEPHSRVIFPVSFTVLIAHFTLAPRSPQIVTLLVCWIGSVGLFLLTMLNRRPVMAITNVTALWVVSSVALHLSSLSYPSPVWILNQGVASVLFIAAYVLRTEWWITTIGLAVFNQFLLYSIYRTLSGQLQREFDAQFKSDRVLRKIRKETARLHQVLNGLLPQWAVCALSAELDHGTAFEGPAITRSVTSALMFHVCYAPLIEGIVPLSASLTSAEENLQALLDLSTEHQLTLCHVQADEATFLLPPSPEAPSAITNAARQAVSICSAERMRIAVHVGNATMALLRVGRLIFGLFGADVVAVESACNAFARSGSRHLAFASSAFLRSSESDGEACGAVLLVQGVEFCPWVLEDRPRNPSFAGRIADEVRGLVDFVVI